MIYLVIGRRKRGKTTLSYYMVKRSSPGARLCFDPRRMIPPSAESVIVTTSQGLTEQAIPALLDGECREVVYAPNADDLTRPYETFCAEVKRWIVEYPTKQLAVMIDELGFIEPARREPPTLKRALRSCEPEVVDVYFTCHRPSDVPTTIRSIADYWCLFQVTQEHDLDVVRERCKREVAEIVPTLAGRSFVLYRDTRAIDPKTGKEQPEYEIFPERSAGAWFVPLVSAGEREYKDRFDALERDEKRLDGRLTFD